MISGGDLFPNARNYLFLCVIGNDIRFADEIQPSGLDDICLRQTISAPAERTWTSGPL